MTDTQAPIVVSAEDYKQGLIAQSKSQAAEMAMDTTVPGGRYKAGDQWLDANGQPVKASAKAADADEDGYAGMTVAELKDLAATRGIEVPSDARKADIVALLEEADAENGGA